MSIKIIKARPIWQELPINFKVDIVKQLDYDSRCNLRLCSNLDKGIVDRTQLTIKTIILKCEKDFKVQIDVKLYGTEISQQHCFFKTPNFLLKILSNPKISVRRLIMEYILLPELLTGIEKNNVKRIKIDSLFIKPVSRSDTRYGIRDSFLGFFERLEVRTMVLDGECPNEILDKMCIMKQFKTVQGVYLPDQINYSIEPFLHLNSVRLNLQKLSSKDARMLIQSFTNKKKFQPINTFFQIFVEEIMNPAEILFENDSELKEKVTAETEDNYINIRVQTLPMKHSDNVLLFVKCTQKFIGASVCRKQAGMVFDYFDTPLI